MEIARINTYIEECSVIDLITNYSDSARFESLCRACPNYNSRWACPPLSDADRIDHFAKVELHLVKIDLAGTKDNGGDVVAEMTDIIQAVRPRLESLILDREHLTGGRAALFTGMCPHCRDRQCARKEGKPCRNPELVRPSLEALGFDLCQVAKDFFGFEIQWAKNGAAPDYIILLAGLFYN